LTRWEYKVVFLPHTRLRDDQAAGEKVKHMFQIEAVLNEWGSQGWEVVGHSDSYAWDGHPGASFTLKRPVGGAAQ
jgi:hypothetical protein